ncbi:MAG: hypothetical protein NZ529_00465 [Cytophagaceae bacterium]|nr:hypothetical protein [Cytophagaceae bacterium]MDW8455237.1 hypothetical protein [Cytophagaceae bacterium]
MQFGHALLTIKPKPILPAIIAPSRHRHAERIIMRVALRVRVVAGDNAAAGGGFYADACACEADLFKDRDL